MEDRVTSGAILGFTETVTLPVFGPESVTITFYRIADGRGWIHDYNEEVPSVPLISVLTPGPTSVEHDVTAGELSPHKSTQS